MDDASRLIRAQDVTDVRAQSETFRTFARFMGDVRFAPNDRFFERMDDITRRGIVWISTLDEKRRSEGWTLDNIVRGRSCLTMGPLEGSLEWQLHTLGARHIYAIEGNPENLLKCSVLNSLFPEFNAEFALGDVREAGFPTGVDIVFCPGVLYHLAEPHVVLQRIFDLRPQLVFLATQLAVDPDHPAYGFRKLAEPAQVTHRGHTYAGRLFHEGPSRYLAGLDHSQPSVWFYPDDLARLLRDIGFTFEDRHVVDFGRLGVCGSYVCAVPNAKPGLRYRVTLANRMARWFMKMAAKKASKDSLIEKTALRG